MVHIYILGPKLLQWNFLQNSQLSTRSVAHKLFCRFLEFFAILDRNYSIILVPPNNENENYVVHLKRQILLKKTVLTPLKNKQQCNACSNYLPSNQQRSGLRA